MRKDELRKELAELIWSAEYCEQNGNCAECKYDKEIEKYSEMSCRVLRIVDLLLPKLVEFENEQRFDADHYWRMWQGSLVELERAEHRAARAEKAFFRLVHEMYEQDIRPMCDEKFFIESRLKDAEKELAEERKMTDAEMEKATEICKNTKIPCNDCPLVECNDCERISLQYFYDRFKQLKAENTDLSKRICVLEHALDVCEDLYVMAINGKAFEGPSLKAIMSGLSLHDFLIRWAEESIQQIEKDFVEEKKE